MRRQLLLLVLVTAASAISWLSFALLSPYRGYTGNNLLEIQSGLRASQIADLLVARGVLRHRWPFLLRYLAGRPRHSLRAGEYLFDRPLRPIDVYRKLVQGDVYLHSIVIPEGSDRFDMARILNQRLGIDPAQFLEDTKQAGAIRDLDPEAPSLEGYLFPDTYRFPRGASAEAVVNTMLTRFRRIIATRLADQGLLPTPDLPHSGRGAGTPTADSPPPLGRGAGGGVKSWHDVITLASLVEKETPEAPERPLIAGVFVRRLKSGMPLQSDPTVVYAARLESRPIGPITASDIELDSPYNTYRHAGLPPGPIANPGEASIRAALHLAGGDALYFVANNQGGHVFSRTLAEHQRNVARYRRALAALRRNQAAGTNSSPPAQEAVPSAARAQKRGRNQKASHP
jgi:UPF0755 protein